MRTIDPNEERVCRAWQRQGFAGGLATTDGRAIHVVFQGWRAAGPGPDFRDAIVEVAGEGLRFGGVEVHVRTSGWRDHGHDGDPAYDDVAFHVVWRHDGARARTRLGAEVPTVELSRFCAPGALADSDPGASSAATPPHGGFACPGGVAPGTEEDVWLRLRQLGLARMLERAVALEGDMAVAPAEQVWLSATLEALGYSLNAVPFRRLAAVVTFDALALARDRDAASPGGPGPAAPEVMLLGAAGFLPSQRPRPLALDGESAAYAREAERRWLAMRDRCVEEPMRWRDWRFAGVRPSNSPIRRAAAASRLVGPVVSAGLRPWLNDLLRAPDPPRALISPLVDSASFWARRFDFGAPSAPSPVALIGARRMVEVAVNATLPIAVALARTVGDGALEDAAIRAFLSLPARGDNHLSRLMAWQIFGRRVAAKEAAQEQGLLHVYDRWCRRKRCQACPLAVRATDSGRTGDEM